MLTHFEAQTALRQVELHLVLRHKITLTASDNIVYCRTYGYQAWFYVTNFCEKPSFRRIPTFG